MKICVHGQIGAGKTTLINRWFTDDYVIVPEPIDQYNLFVEYYKALQDAQNGKSLTQYQQDIITQFQTSVMFGYVKAYKSLDEKKNYIFERSIQEAYEVFCCVLKKYLDDQHNCALKQIAQIFMQYEPVFDNIYLRQPHSIIMERIKQRARPGEIISNHYIEQLQQAQNRFIQKDKYEYNLKIPYMCGSEFVNHLNELSLYLRFINRPGAVARSPSAAGAVTRSPSANQDVKPVIKTNIKLIDDIYDFFTQ